MKPGFLSRIPPLLNRTSFLSWKFSKKSFCFWLFVLFPKTSGISSLFGSSSRKKTLENLQKKTKIHLRSYFPFLKSWSRCCFPLRNSWSSCEPIGIPCGNYSVSYAFSRYLGVPISLTFWGESCSWRGKEKGGSVPPTLRFSAHDFFSIAVLWNLLPRGKLVYLRNQVVSWW